MSDTPPADDASTPPADDTPADAPPASQPTDPPIPATPEAWQEDRDKWVAMARKHEKAAKKLADIEDAAKTEAQRLAEKATSAEQRAIQAETALARLRVASSKGLPPELADRLVGSTEEELAEDADRLMALVKPTDGTPPKPAGSADTGPQGAPDSSKPKQLSRTDLAGMTSDEITEAKAKGQLNDLLGIS